MAQRTRSLLRAALLGTVLMLPAGQAYATLERAQAAQARGDLRTAQIELRNAVRRAPDNGALRYALAQASLDLGDADTAEKEARAAIERGHDRVASTALLIRAQIALNRAREVLREFAEPAAGTEPRLAGVILAGRAAAQLTLDQAADARRSAEAAVAVAPGLAEAHIVLAAVRVQAGDRAGAEAALDAALRIEPDNVAALLRKTTFLVERGELPAAVEVTSRAIAAQPGNVLARLQRAEIRLRQGDNAAARADVEAALRTAPGHAGANYMLAVLQVRAQEWRQAEETLNRLGAVLPNTPEGLLLMATVKQQLNQTAQAIDAAQRHVARRPEDPRGARLLAALELQANRPRNAAEVLNNLVRRGVQDVEAYDLLGRAQIAAGRPREAAEAFARADALAPGDATRLARLAASRLSIGDFAGMAEAAQGALRANPAVPGARLMLAMGEIAQGNVAAAEAELGRLDDAQRQGEAAQVLRGMIQFIRYEPDAARATFEGVLRANPDSVPARLGLARVATSQGRAEEAERLLGEVLQRDPGNAEALGRLAATALAGGPRAAAGLALLEQAQAANPDNAGLAFALATVLARSGHHERAVALLQSDALRSAPGQGGTVALRLSEVRAAQERWPEAEAAARSALAENPRDSRAMRQLALLLARRGDHRAAEALIDAGLRSAPTDPLLLGTSIALAQQQGGVDAALATVERLGRLPGAATVTAPLRGDVLMGAGRAADAAQAYAAAARANPSAELTMRQAAALVQAERRDEAVELLRAWIARSPDDVPPRAMLAQLAMQRGDSAEAEREFRAVAERAPRDAIALNNLAWLLQEKGGAEALREARGLAERAFFLAPTVEIADTLGWILARGGEPQRALPLLRQAVAGAQGTNPAAAAGMAYRLAWTLAATGERAEAARVLEPLLARSDAFPERAEAERLMAELRRG
ncbi:putative PEP-CTERM system TPR-repeat lipoprotein [Roseomonas alkaliterrae]|uniref:Putative PEP-CTERM system TPR-repeat lipoprotein n=3 Tax=Neoroseomonas alkaliterrae TaxID=1452450 RepID=A0A840Y499_9PROT|nr:XrtA/PEP-CTERM system TPR-repeat protein PrsT [Neoroseomonas alkaliterrae]MBB5691187.1 putative PEP-CTERM system TPR-repeat lipoprotein [Neoroseomonas alkaliterrae]